LVFSGTVQWMSRFFQASGGLSLQLDEWLVSLMGSG
jgi:hypothetical protein